MAILRNRYYPLPHPGARHPARPAASRLPAPARPRSAARDRAPAARSRAAAGAPAPSDSATAAIRSGAGNERLTNPSGTFMFTACKASPDAPYGTLGRGGSVPEVLGLRKITA